MQPRIRNLYKKLKEERLDSLIVSSPANIFYLCGFPNPDAYLLFSEKEIIYLTDSRYIEAAKKRLQGMTLKMVEGPAFKMIADLCHSLNIKYLGFEERDLSFAGYRSIRKHLDKGIELSPTSGLIEELREVKSGEEINKIAKATQITILALNFIQDFIAPGIREVEIAAELERFIRYCGAYACSFDIIVASGINSTFVHHMTSQKKIARGESVLIDIGVEYQGYKSDLTRVYFLDRITPEIRRVYSTVVEAQRRAIKRIRPGIKLQEIDAAARQYISQQGWGRFFLHNLGHGIGLEVHEEPHLSAKEENKLKPGMVLTIEPGIYLPGKFGVRVEDMVLVTKKGAKVLSGTLNK